MKRYLIPILFLATFAAASAQRASVLATPRPPSSATTFVAQAFDVLGYDAFIRFDWVLAKREAWGTCDISMRWVEAPSDTTPFYFHLRGPRVDRVLFDSVEVTVIPVGDSTSVDFHYRVNPPASVEVGDTSVVRVEYSGTMRDEDGPASWGGVNYRDSVLYAMGVGFGNDYVSATRHWLPCYDHPSDKATFHAKFVVPYNQTVASNGLVNVLPGNAITTFEWTHDIPCATYLYTFAASDYIPLEFGDGTLPMVVYARPVDTADARAAFTRLPEMVQHFSERYGPYPFEKVGYVLTPDGAMEHETMVSIATRTVKDGDPTHTIPHELAHQWFGDYVSPRDFRHAWLTEAFATFSEVLWVEEASGFPAYLDALSMKIGSYLGAIKSNEGIFPLYDFPREAPSSNYPQTIYEKGAAVVAMLRYELGDSLFFSGLRAYLSRHAYGVATTEDLRTTLEEHTGRSLGWFFNQWVYRKGWPKLSIGISSTPTSPGYNRVRVHVQQLGGDTASIYRKLPLGLGFLTTGGQTEHRMLTIDNESETFVLDSIPDYVTVSRNRGPLVRALIETVTGADVEESDESTPDAVRVRVHPNPADGKSALTIQVSGTDDCRAIAYELYDAAGARVLNGSADSCGFTIPTAGLASRSYLLHLTVDGVPHDVPVVITR